MADGTGKIFNVVIPDGWGGESISPKVGAPKIRPAR
jgi:hypothetical protein